MAQDIARRWHSDRPGLHCLFDAAGHAVAMMMHRQSGTYQGIIYGRDGRDDRIVESLPGETAKARRALELVLSSLRSSDSERALIACRLASPMRPLARTAADVDGLALFDVVRSPVLL